MANPPQEIDEAFLREVDEGVRRDQVASLWQRYGRIGIVLLLLFLAGLGGWLYWRDQQLRLAGVAGEEFVAALDKLDVGEGPAARATFARLQADGPGGYTTLAEMMQAADAVAGGDTARAIKLFDAIAADSARPQALRDAALLKSVRLGFDTLPPATIVARLKPFAMPGNPWFGIAAEMSAIAHLKAGEIAPAKTLLTAIVRDNGAPPSLRGRAAQLALANGVDAALLQAAAGAPPAGPAK